MIDVERGAIRLADRRVLGPGFTYEQYQAIESEDDQPARLAFISKAGRRFIVNPVFDQDGMIIAYLIALDDPKLGSSWEHCSEENETQRKKIHDHFLQAEVGVKPPATFPWGKLESRYEERSFLSMIIVDYLRSAQ